MVVIMMIWFANMVKAAPRIRAGLWRAAFVCLLACTGAAAGAETESYAPFEANGWKGFAHRSVDSGAFSHCSLRATYDDDTTLGFMMSASYKLQIGLANPDWDLERADIADTAFEVDGRQIYRGGPISVRSMSVRFAFGDSDAAFNALRRGRALTILGASQTMRFSLDGTFQALSRLVKCVDVAAGYGSPSRNPFAAPNRPARKSNPFAIDNGAGEADRSATMQTALATILDAAGFRKVRFVDPPTSASIAWKTQSFSGFLSIVTLADLTQKQLIDELLSEAQDICTGDFAYGLTAPEHHGAYVMREAVMSCPVGETILRVSLLAGFHGEGHAVMIFNRNHPHATYGQEQVTVMADLRALFAAVLAAADE